MLTYQNKNVVITGAASGIGKTSALTFARQGATIYVIDLNEKATAQTVAEIEEAGGKAVACPCDVTDQQQVIQTFVKIGTVDVLLNNAGISNIGKADTTSEEDFEKVFKVNVKGVYNCLHAAIPLMRSAGGGVILNMCSVAAYTGIADRFAYSMSKGAIFAMTMSVAKDYIKDNIRCNCISPARIHTPFVDDYLKKNYPGKEKEMFEALSKTQPIGRMGSAQEVATFILYLCSSEAAFITGCDYPIDGGFVRLNT